MNGTHKPAQGMQEAMTVVCITECCTRVLLRIFCWTRGCEQVYTEGVVTSLQGVQSMNHVCSRAALAALILCLCASLAFAQSDLGSISGFVKDPSGAVIPNAKVSVRNPSG